MDGLLNSRTIHQQIENLRLFLHESKRSPSQTVAATNGRSKLIKSISLLFLHCSNLFTDGSNRISDYRAIDCRLEGSSIRQRITSTINKSQDQKANSKHTRSWIRQLAEQASFYDKHISDHTIRERLLLFLCEVLYGSLVSVVVFLLVRYRLSQFSNQNFSVSSVLRFCGLTLVYALSNCLLIVITSLEQKIKLIVRRVLQEFIYSKLLIADNSFLEMADNNTIHLIIYCRFEDSYDSQAWWLPLTPMLMMLATVGYQAISSRAPDAFLVAAVIIIRLAFAAITQCMESKILQKLRQRAGEQKNLMYEFLSHFRDYNLKKLGPRFQAVLEGMSVGKTRVLTSLLNLTFLEELPIACLLLFSLFYSALQQLVYDARQAAASPQPKTPLRTTEMFFAALFVHLVTKTCIRRFRSLISKRHEFERCRSLIDEFFNGSLCSIHGVSQNEEQSKLLEGEIVIDNCNVYSRDKQVVKDFLARLTSTSRQEDCGPVEGVKKRSPRDLMTGKPFLKNLQPSKKDKVISKASKIEEHSKRDWKIALRNVKLHFHAGTRVCIFENNNKKLVRSFIDMLLGQALLEGGKFLIRGSISYFNPNRKHILVGKTIRDNILFGSAFRQERYDNILKVLSLQFGNYNGQDFHQVAENGSNLRKEDVKAMLFARFLYQDCHIYIIEDYLTDLDMGLMKELISTIIKHTLQKKTLFLCSNHHEIIKLADHVVCLDSEEDVRVLSRDAFFETFHSSNKPQPISRSMSGLEKLISNKRIEVLRNKLKNSLFIENLGFEEELTIHKNQEATKKEIERMIKQNSRVLDLLTFGIYLAHKKKQSGQFFKPLPRMKIADVSSYFKKFFWNSQMKKLLLLLFVLHSASRITLLIIEARLIDLSSDAPSKDLNLRSLSLPLMLLLVYFTLGIIKFAVFRSASVRLLKHSNRVINQSILKSRIIQIVRRRAHTVLENIGSDLNEIEANLPRLLNTITSRSVALVMNTAVVFYCDCFLSLIPIFFLCYAVFQVFRTLIPVQFKIFVYSILLQSKLDDLNFQLLSLIGGYRIAGRIQMLLNNIDSLCDNSSLVRAYRDRNIKLTVCFFALLLSSMYLSTCFTLTLLGFWNITNWMQISPAYFIWASLCSFRGAFLLAEIAEEVLIASELIFKMVRIALFIEDQSFSNSEPTVQALLPHHLDYSAGLLFKDVTVTTSFQPIIKRISFRVLPKSRVGLFGIDGGGRSKIFDLICGLLRRNSQDKSKLKLFGQDIENLSETVIKQVVFFIERSPVLFAGTVMQNLDPYDEHPRDAVAHLLRDVGIGVVLEKTLQSSSVQSTSPVEAGRTVEFRDTFEEKQSLINHINLKNHSAGDYLQGNSTYKSDTFMNIRIEEQQRNFSLKGSLETIRHKKVVLEKEGLNPAGQFDLYLQKQGIATRHQHRESIISSKDRQPLEDSKLKSKDPLQFNASKHTSNHFVDIPSTPFLSDKPSCDPKEIDTDSKALPDRGFKDSRTYLMTPSNITEAKSNELSTKKATQDFDDQSKRKDSKNKGLASTEVKINVLASTAVELIDEERKSAEARTGSLLKVPISLQPNLDTEGVAQELQKKEAAAEKFTDENTHNFLATTTGFAGKNISLEARKVVVFCRAILEQPPLLLICEESLSFGQGIEWNLKYLSQSLPESTIMVITKDSHNLFFYDSIVFMDAGRVLDKGSPLNMIRNPESYLSRYLKETDKHSLLYLRERLKLYDENQNFTGKRDRNIGDGNALGQTIKWKDLDDRSPSHNLPQQGVDHSGLHKSQLQSRDVEKPGWETDLIKATLDDFNAPLDDDKLQPGIKHSVPRFENKSLHSIENTTKKQNKILQDGVASRDRVVSSMSSIIDYQIPEENSNRYKKTAESALSKMKVKTLNFDKSILPY